jgi:hypothetical protein
MYQKQSIYDDVEFNRTTINPESTNSQPGEMSGINITTILVVGAIVIVITIAGTYYFTRRKYDGKSINWMV